MKKILSYAIVGIICLSIGAYASMVYNAKDIEYSNSKTTATNVQDAIDELLSNSSNCIYGKIDNPSECGTSTGCLIEEGIKPNYFIVIAYNGYDFYDNYNNPNVLTYSRISQGYYNKTSDMTSSDYVYYLRGENSLILRNYSSDFTGHDMYYMVCE